MPIIQSGMFQFFIIRRKSHFSNKVQACACNGTGPCNVSCVLRDFRFYKYDMELCQIIITFLWGALFSKLLDNAVDSLKMPLEKRAKKSEAGNNESQDGFISVKSRN